MFQNAQRLIYSTLCTSEKANCKEFLQVQMGESRMINLLQESIEMESQRTNSTFAICTSRHTKYQPEKNKKAIFYQRLNKYKLEKEIM